MEQNRELNIKPCIYSSLIFEESAHTIQWSNVTSSTPGIGKTGYVCVCVYVYN